MNAADRKAIARDVLTRLGLDPDAPKVKKIAYTATFVDGMQITRKSHRSYSAAWRARRADGSTQTGFSFSQVHALKQATGWERHGFKFEITTNLTTN